MSAVYTYRADGLRNAKTVNGYTTTHLWDRGNIVLERSAGGAVVNRFRRGLGHLISSDQHGFYLFNVRGDVVQRVDSYSDVIHTYRYDAFGNQLNGDDVNTNPFRFAGEYYDWETGFIYLRARFYNPVLGRFISEDPHWNIRNMQFGSNPITKNGRYIPDMWAIMQAGNLYAFCVNNPVKWIDPSGEAITASAFVAMVASFKKAAPLFAAGGATIAYNQMITNSSTMSSSGDLTWNITNSARGTQTDISSRATDVAFEQLHQVEITVVGNTITVDGVSFVVNELAEHVVWEMNENNIRYFAAMRMDDVIMVAPIPISREVAETIIAFDDKNVGIFARNQAIARDLTRNFGGPDPRTPERHGATQGHWYHIHSINMPRAHIWFA